MQILVCPSTCETAGPIVLIWATPGCNGSSEVGAARDQSVEDINGSHTGFTQDLTPSRTHEVYRKASGHTIVGRGTFTRALTRIWIFILIEV